MFEQLINMVFSASFGYSIIRITSPILFAALAAVVAEKGGRNYDDLRIIRCAIFLLDK